MILFVKSSRQKEKGSPERGAGSAIAETEGFWLFVTKSRSVENGN